MKKISYFMVASMLIISCEFENEINIVKHAVNGVIININNPTKFDGMHLYLESSYYSMTEGSVIETISESIISDSGKFDFEYESSPGNTLTIRCIELPNFVRRIGINENLDLKYYYSDSATLAVNFNTTNNINTNETLYIKYTRPTLNDPIIEYYIGPLPINFSKIYRGYNYGSYNFTWGRGFNDLENNGHMRHKNFNLRGDPFIDSAILNY